MDVLNTERDRLCRKLETLDLKGLEAVNDSFVYFALLLMCIEKEIIDEDELELSLTQIVDTINACVERNMAEQKQG